MAKGKDVPPVEPAEDPTATPAAETLPEVRGYVEKRAYKPHSNPKVAPRYLFDCVFGLGTDDYVYHLEGVDEADCKSQGVASNKAFAVSLPKLRFSATRQSWTPTNVEKLTVAQVEALNGLTDEEKIPLMDKAIPDEKAA